MLISDSSVSSLEDSELLRQFSTEKENRRHRAWKEFLSRHSELILKTVWQFESDRDAAMEVYLYVCEQLADQQFSKLRDYDRTRGKTPAKVTTWLTVVVRNLCIDHHRQKEGRSRYPDAVADLSALDQKVFELYFWDGYSQREIVCLFETNPDYDEHAVSSAVDRLLALELRPSQTWARQPPSRFESFEEALHGEAHSVAEERADGDRREWIETLLEDLPPKERLAVRWYFWTGVSASGIGQLLELSERKVYMLLDDALGSLRENVGVSIPEP